MQLKTWMDAKGFSVSDVQREARTTWITAKRARDGVPVRLATAKKISAITAGAVPVVTLVMGTEITDAA